VGLFQKIFRTKDEQAAERFWSQFKTLSAYQPIFTSRQGSVYEMLLTRAAIHTLATHSSKLKPEVIGAANAPLRTILQTSANPLMNISQLIYRTRTILEIETAAFIIPLYDLTGNIIQGFWSILPSRADVVEDPETGDPWLRYQFTNGKRAAVPWNRVAVVTKYQYADDFFGTNNTPLTGTLDVMHIQEEGMQDAVKQAANIRFLAQVNGQIRPEDITRKRDAFAADNLAADNKTGLLVYDNTFANLTPVNSQPWIVSPAQMKLIQGNVNSYFGVNEAILQNSFTEEQWNAFYEGAIEPFAVNLGMELTRVCFTPREISAKNRIMFSSNRLEYASNQTKVTVVQQLADRGIMSLEDAAEVFNLAPPSADDGKTRVIRGEYITLDKLPENRVTPQAMLAPLVAEARASIQRRRTADAEKGRGQDVTMAFALEKLGPLAEAYKRAGLEFDPEAFATEALGMEASA
jgi:hypothetical protein